MVDHGCMRECLMNATIDVVYESGIEKCTSKRISASSKINEAYIFRYFEDITDLRKKAFLFVVTDFAFKALHRFSSFESATFGDMEDAIASTAQRYAKENQKQTVYCIRYLASAEYTKDIHNEAIGIFDGIVTNIKFSDSEATAAEIYRYFVSSILSMFTALGNFDTNTMNVVGE